MDCSPLGSSVHRILQTRILEWGLPCSPSGDRPNSGIEPESPAAPALQVDSSPLNHWGSPSTSILSINIQGWLPLGLTGGISLLSFGWKKSCSLWFFILHWDDFYLVEHFPVCKKSTFLKAWHWASRNRAASTVRSRTTVEEAPESCLMHSWEGSPTAEGCIFPWLGMGHTTLEFQGCFILLHCPACGILVPQPGIKPAPPALEAQSLNHKTPRDSLKGHCSTAINQVTVRNYFFQFSSVQFSHSVVSNSLRPHGLQHARPPCP